MSEELKLIAIITIENIISLICFTVLAVVFEKWWIVLFSALFQTYFKKKNK